MESVREIKSRIRSINSIQQITSAMELISVSRLKRLESKVKMSRAYIKRLRDLIENISSAREITTHPLMVAREPKAIGVLIITSDRGLCGAYNSNVIRLSHNFIEDQKGKREIKLFLIGKKGYDFFKKRPYQIIKYQPQFSRTVTSADSRAIAQELIQGYSEERYDEIHIFFTKFTTVIHILPARLMLLPFKSMETMAIEEKRTKFTAEYLYEPSREKIWETLLPWYVETQIYQAILESMTSEHGARMVSMKSATENAKDLIADLTLTCNKARQAAITKELIEITTGTEAIRHG
jgi:F-type H+-transporting ATPase subunit gamma